MSVIVPSYNSREVIQQCLRSLLEQRTGRDYEVIVVDSSTDGTPALVREEFPWVTLVHLAERTSCGMARNVGMQRSRGEVCLFIDTDCVAPPTWIEDMSNALHDSGADGICGAFSNGTPWSIPGTVGFLLEFFRFVGPRGRPVEARFLLGGNSGYRRSAVASRVFSAASPWEDFKFSWELSAAGGRCMFVPSIVVEHRNRRGLREVVSYQYRLGRGAALNREVSAPVAMRWLRAFPVLVGLLPLVVVGWIGGKVLRRSSWGGIWRLLVVWPLVVVFHGAWALGFYAGLSESRPQD